MSTKKETLLQLMTTKQPNSKVFITSSRDQYTKAAYFNVTYVNTATTCHKNNNNNNNVNTATTSHISNNINSNVNTTTSCHNNNNNKSLQISLCSVAIESTFCRSRESSDANFLRKRFCWTKHLIADFFIMIIVTFSFAWTSYYVTHKHTLISALLGTFALS